MSIGPVSPQASLLSNPALLQALYPNIDLSGLSQLEQENEAALEAPVQAISSQISTLNQVSAAWSTIQGSVNALQADAASLADATTWATAQASSTTGSVASAQASATAEPGTYNVSVTTVGQFDEWLSQSASSSTAALGLSGSFSINGTSITVAASDSLQSIAAAVNAADAGANAQVLTSQSGGTTTSYLEISSTKDAALTISDPNGIFAGAGSSGLGMTETQTGQAWQYTIDGVATTSETGTDTTTVPGLTITLAGAGTTTISVTDSTSGAQAALGQFTSDYNALQAQIAKDTGKGAVLEGDPTAEGILGQVNQVLLSLDPSRQAGYQSATDVGLTLALQSDKTTKLEFSSTAFAQATQANLPATEAIFTGTGGIMGQLSTVLENLGQASSGIIAGIVSNISTQVTDLTAQQTSEQDLINIQQSAMQAQFQQEMQALISVSAQETSMTSLFNQYMSQGQGQSGSSSKPGG